MRFYQSEALINASPQAVWSILTDAKRLVAIGTGITRLDGQIAPGARLKLFAEVAPNRAFKLKVVRFEPGRAMVWQGGMPLGLFTGRRSYSLRAEGAATRLVVREDFTGPMAGLIWKSMPDLQPSFDRFTAAVKHAAEEVA